MGEKNNYREFKRIKYKIITLKEREGKILLIAIKSIFKFISFISL